MRVLRIDDRSPYLRLVGVGGLGTGIFFELEGTHTLGRNESRPARLLDVRDYCKLHIVIHYVAKLLGAQSSGVPFHVVPVGRVGDDGAGKFVIREMQSAGIDTSLVKIVEHQPTLFSVCFQYPDGTGGNITTNNSVASEMTSADVDECSHLFNLDGRSIALAVPEVPLSIRRRLLQLASHAGCLRVASFVAAEIVPARELGMFDLLDVVAFNEYEAGHFAGCAFSAEDPQPFIDRYRAITREQFKNLRVVVSVGKSGAYGFSEGDYSYCPAPAAAVASTAGAGDALLGGVIAALAAGIPLLKERAGGELENASIESALQLGVLLGSFKVTSHHTIHPDVSLSNLLEFGEQSGVLPGSNLATYLVEC